MTSGPTAAPWRPALAVSGTSWAISLACVLAGAGLFFLLRWAQPIQGLGNHDIAGIAYGADLLLRGELPYLDSIELKTPGSFYLVAAAWLLAGRSAAVLHGVCTLWIFLGAGALFAAAYITYQDRDHPRSREVAIRCAGLAAGIYLASSGQWDSNYTTWMMPPYAAAYAALMAGLRQDRFSAHLLAGGFAGLAYLFKNHAAVIVAVAGCAWIWARRRGEPGARAKAWLGWALGAAAALLPISTHYLAQGAWPDLIAGLFPLAKYSDYAQRVDQTPGLVAAYRLLAQLLERFPAEFCWGLGTLGLALWVGYRQSRRSSPPAARVRIEPLAPTLAFLVLSISAGGLGGLRYYDHYAAQYLPGFALLAAHPALWRWASAWLRNQGTRWFRQPVPVANQPPGSASLGPVALAVLLTGAILGTQRLEQVFAGTQRVAFPAGTALEQAGRYIQDRSAPTDTLQCWGWASWPVYFWANRHAPGRLYKELGAVTRFNFNSDILNPPDPAQARLDWKPGPIADQLLRDFQTKPPAFLVRARPFFPGIHNDPLDESGPLAAWIAHHYRQVATFDGLDIYQYQVRPALTGGPVP